jgi:hypothetical protein
MAGRNGVHVLARPFAGCLTRQNLVGVSPGEHLIYGAGRWTNPHRGYSTLTERSQKEFEVFVAGGGFPAFWYNYGLAAATVRDSEVVWGASAGAMVGCGVAAGVPFNHMLEAAASAIARHQENARIGSLQRVIVSFLERAFPDGTHELVSGRLRIVLCEPTCGFLPSYSYSGNAKVISDFESGQDLRDALLASA